MKLCSVCERKNAEISLCKSNRSPLIYFQVLAALSVSLGSMVVGYASSYTSPALVSMSKDEDFELNKQMVSTVIDIFTVR